MLRQPAALAAKKRAEKEAAWEKLQEERANLAGDIEEKEVYCCTGSGLLIEALVGMDIAHNSFPAKRGVRLDGDQRSFGAAWRVKCPRNVSGTTERSSSPHTASELIRARSFLTRRRRNCIGDVPGFRTVEALKTGTERRTVCTW